MLNKIKNKLLSKDGKVLIENFISLSSLQLLGMLLPLITLPYLLRTLGMTNYGLVILASSLVSYFTAVTDFSFRITATRDVSIFRNSKKKLDIIFSKVVIIQTILLMVSIAVICGVILLYPPFFEHKEVFFLSILFLIGYTYFPDWFFQGIEKMKYITVINLSVKIFFTICVFVFIKKESDYWIYPLLYGLGFVFSGLIGYIILLKKYRLNFIFLKKRTLIQTCHSNIPVFMNQFLPNLYNNTSVFLLGILTTSDNVGIFDAIKKVVNLGSTAINLLSRVFFPFLNRKRNSFSSYKRLMLTVGLLLTVLPILFSDLIFWYLNIDREGSLKVLVILSLGLFFVTLYDIFGVNYFIIKRQDKLVMKNTLIASLVGFVLSFPMIMYFGLVGASLNLTLSRSIMGIGLWLKYKKEDKILN